MPWQEHVAPTKLNQRALAMAVVLLTDCQPAATYRRLHVCAGVERAVASPSAFGGTRQSLDVCSTPAIRPAPTPIRTILLNIESGGKGGVLVVCPSQEDADVENQVDRSRQAIGEYSDPLFDPLSGVLAQHWRSRFRTKCSDRINLSLVGRMHDRRRLRPRGHSETRIPARRRPDSLAFVTRSAPAFPKFAFR